MVWESTEVQMARMDERLQQILREMELSRDGSKQQYEKLENINQSVALLETRVKGVEDGLNKASPTIDEFITIKHKVVGAGLLGKWVWAFGGGLLSALAFSREAVFAWFSK
jgi:cyanate lyase